jgi:carboxypeptidase D
MIAYMEKVHTGVRGLVTDSITGEPLEAEIQVEGREHKVYSDGDIGDYYRLLLPGTYNLIFEAEGYRSKTISGVVVNEGTATVLDIELEKSLSINNVWIYY